METEQAKVKVEKQGKPLGPTALVLGMDLPLALVVILLTGFFGVWHLIAPVLAFLMLLNLAFSGIFATTESPKLAKAFLVGAIACLLVAATSVALVWWKMPWLMEHSMIYQPLLGLPTHY